MDDDYFTIRIPKPKRRWFQYRLATVFLLITIVALICVYVSPMLREWQTLRATQMKVEQCVQAQKAATKQWYVVYTNYGIGNATIQQEAVARKAYFDRRCELEEAKAELNEVESEFRR